MTYFHSDILLCSKDYREHGAGWGKPRIQSSAQGLASASVASCRDGIGSMTPELFHQTIEPQLPPQSGQRTPDFPRTHRHPAHYLPSRLREYT